MDFIDAVRDANAIEDVIGADLKLKKSGNHLHAEADPSFVVYPGTGTYRQFGDPSPATAHLGEGGDVFKYIMLRDRVDFWQAALTLAKRAYIEPPARDAETVKRAQSQRQMADAMAVVREWAEHRLWKSEKAVSYARGRGWSDHTIHFESALPLAAGEKTPQTVRGAGLGYTGDGWDDRNTLKDFAAARGITSDHPALVCILGYAGDVALWWRKWAALLAEPEAPQEWVLKQKIAGLPYGLLLYPYFDLHGQVVSFHGRNIAPDCDDADKHRHLKEQIVGAKRPFYNHLFTRLAPLVGIVEGEGDAVSYGQLGIPAIALGSRGSQSVNDEAAQLLRGMVTKYKTVVFLTPDQDDTPTERAKSLEKMLAFGERLGPRTRLITPDAITAGAQTQF